MFFFEATVLKCVELLGGWKLVTNLKFQHNASNIMPARAKNTGTWGVEYRY